MMSVAASTLVLLVVHDGWFWFGLVLRRGGNALRASCIRIPVSMFVGRLVNVGSG